MSFLGSTPTFTFDDFNKNDLHKNFEIYRTTPPSMKIIYEIEHAIDFNKTHSTFEKLEKFLQYKEDGNICEENNTAILSIIVEFRFELEPQFLEEYKTSMAQITEFNKFYKLFNIFLCEILLKH